MNPYMRRKQKRPVGEAGRRSEKRTAKQVGGRLRPGSGAVEGAKGDIVLQELLLEVKSTASRTMRLEHAWCAKIAKEALDQSMTPAVAVNFTHADGRAVPEGEWVLIRRIDFMEKFT